MAFDVPVLRERQGRLTVHFDIARAIDCLVAEIPREYHERLEEYAKLYMLKKAGIVVYPLPEKRRKSTEDNGQEKE